MLQLVWLEDVKNYLQIGQMLGIIANTIKKWLKIRTKPFTLQNGILYCMSQDNK